ncbi:MAG: amidase family protein [Pseudomonadota bacterium]
MPTSNGFGGAPWRVPAVDAEVVRRLRAAGAVILGKLNMHEGALGATNDNPHFGRATNRIAPASRPAGRAAARAWRSPPGCALPRSAPTPAARCGCPPPMRRGRPEGELRAGQHARRRAAQLRARPCRAADPHGRGMPR